MINMLAHKETADSGILTISDLNLFKKIQKRNLKHNQTSGKHISFMLISETAELNQQRSKL